MTDSKNFLAFILHTLKGLEVGDYSRVDTGNAAFDGELENTIIDTLRHILRRDLLNHEALRKCVIGDYSVALKNSDAHDITGSLIHAVLEKLRGVVQQANVIALGDYSAEISPQSERDELGIALYRMTKTLREVAEVSVAISSGDFTKQVEAKGKQDYLAQAMNNMIESLREVERQASAIASGEYNVQITPRSDRDELARSIDKMMRVIRSQLIALIESNESLTEFAHVASHDLNAPLCKIKYCCELISEACLGKLPDNVYKLFDVINRSCDQLLRLIGDLLEHASIDGCEPVLSEVDLHQLTKESISDLSEDLEAANARVLIRSLPVVLGQRTLLKRLLQNLIGNALKYRSKSPLILEIMTTEDKN
jgi:signal transduction histidine kinase